MNNWEQKYKDLIARLQKAKENDDVCDERYCCVIDEIAQELKESEDEQHRRWILEYLYDGLRKSDEQFKDQFKAAIAWLEKQGEQKVADKIGPKFNIGDWVVYDHRPYQVVELPKEGYINLGLKENGKIEFAPSTYCRHWTIRDAKDGDLIYVSTEEKGIQAIFHEYKNDTIFFHCYLCSDFAQGGYMPIGSVELVYPLQKTHYNRFFEKMHEAGYEWDADKKESKKIEQNPADKVEPKFHEGDILKHNKANIICKVLSANVGFYSLMNILGGDEMELFNVEKNFHLWTIQDAKDGDVLATSAGAFIYNGNNGGGSCPGCYCGIDTLGNFKTGVEHHWTGKPAFPATKSQRDTLFTKMKESGYEWDSEKKELKLLITNGGDFDKKNCEWNPAWSEDDEEKFRDVIRLIEQGAPVQSMRDHYTNWFKSLKDRVQPIHEYSDTEKQEIFLRSQRPHFWRPTKGQLECLDVAIDKVDKDHSPFFTNRAYLTLKALKKQLEQL